MILCNTPSETMSVEMYNDDFPNNHQWIHLMPQGSRIFVPHFATSNLSNNIKFVKFIIDNKLVPVVYCAARNIENEVKLNEIINDFVHSGVTEFLFLAGAGKIPKGYYSNSLQILSSGVLQKHDNISVSFAGHPEEHPIINESIMWQFLKDKINYAKKYGINSSITTQFCFSPHPYIDFLDKLQDSDICVPVRLGVAGNVGYKKLLKYSKISGVGKSIEKLISEENKNKSESYSPKKLIDEINDKLNSKSYNFPVYLHLYPFGNVSDSLNDLSSNQNDNLNIISPYSIKSDVIN